MRLARVWLVVLALGMSFGLLAQEAVIQETNPPFLKWYQIKSPNFTFLYPDGFQEQAERMANTLEHIRVPEARTMGARPRRLTFILQNQSSESNGFVTLAPRRSEFYTMPSQNYNLTGTNDWLNFLASHEYRHVVQFQLSNTGFTRFFYTLFGQQVQAGLAYVAAPQWFWEGDAVATETAFTHSGRGRIPNFDLIFRTNLLEGRTFNYHKQYLRSFKDNIPSHYVIGYHMVSYLRKKTGDPEIWEKIAKRAWGVPFIPFTFSNAIHKETGLYVTALYREMAASLISQWKEDLDKLQFTSFVSVTPRNTKTYTDYLNPQVLADGSILAQKVGIGDIEQLVVLGNGTEEKKHVQGQINSTGMLSAAGEKVVWNEYFFDPRWLVRTYSNIKSYDLSKKTSRTLTHKSRYGGAALSPDGKKVATVQTTNNYKTQLVILDYETGGVIAELPNPGNDFISMPHWTEDGKSVVAVRTRKEGKSLSRFDAGTGTYEELLDAGFENIGYPVPFHNLVFYNSAYSGIDNIYVLDTSNGKRFQVTSSRYGSYNPAVSTDGSTLYYNEQTRDGMDVVKIPLDKASWIPIEQVTKIKGTYEHLVEQEGRPRLLDSIENRQYVQKRYHRATGMVNPHSWGPYFTSGLTQAQVGLFSQDLLSTTSISAGYLYDINERTGSFQAGISYQGFFPILDFLAFSGTRQDRVTVADRSVKLNWQETGTTVGFRVPLTFTRSKYLAQLEIGNSVSYTRVHSFRSKVNKGDTVVSEGNDRLVPVKVRDSNGKLLDLDYLLSDQVNNGNLVSNYFHLTYIHILKQSRRDFNPKFGQYIYFEHYSTPFGGDFSGKLWNIRGVLYFPGFAKHHSIYLRGGYQKSPTSFELNSYTFRNRLVKPRGYGYPADNTFSTISGNYQLPLWYPDIALGPVLNIQRVKANFFYDYGHGEHTQYFYDVPNNAVYSSQQSLDYKSMGFELTFDVNVMRFLPQIELGVRVSRIGANPNYNSATVVEFLLGNIPF